MTALSDIELISRVLQHDDRNAFGDLVRKYQSPVRSFMRKLSCGDWARADDLAQETFLRAYLCLASFRGEAKFTTWLYRIGYNIFIREKKGVRLDAFLPKDSLVNSMHKNKRSSLLQVDLDRAMEVLTEPERAVIALCYSRGLSHGEAALVLECPLGTIKTHIMRGKEKLRERLSSWKEKV